jgi:thiamine transport system permease protein
MSKKLKFAKTLPLLFILLILYYPLLHLFTEIYSSNISTLPRILLNVFSDSYYLDVIFFSFWQALISTLGVLILVFPCCYALVNYKFPGKSVLLASLTVPFIMPPIILVLGLMQILGNDGFISGFLIEKFNLDISLNKLFGTAYLILAAHIIYEFSIVLRILYTFWSNLDPDIERAAKILGSSPISTFIHVTFPILFPVMIAAASLVFIFSFCSFGIILILGGGNFSNLETEIYYSATRFFQIPTAVVLSMIQMVIIFATLLIYIKIQNRVTRSISLVSHNISRAKGIQVNSLPIMIVLSFVAMCVLLPFLSLGVSSVINEGELDFTAYISIFFNQQDSVFFVSPVVSIYNSVGFATLTVLLSVPLGLVISYILRAQQYSSRSILDAVYMLPLGISSITLGLALLLSLSFNFFDLRSTWVPLVLAHVLIAYPFVMRIIFPSLNSIDSLLIDSAKVLGASPKRIFWSVEFPIISRPILVSCIFAFAISIGEFGASLLISRPEHTTIPVAIFHYLSRPGQYNLDNAVALSTLLMIIAGSGFLLIEKIRFKGWGDF